MNLSIGELNDTNIDLWEEFNQKMEEGTFFHTNKWKKILESVGYTSHYFLIFDDEEIVGICPFFETNIKGFKGIATLPLSDYNHLIVKDNNEYVMDFIRRRLELKAKNNSWSFILLNSLDKNFENNFNKSYLKYTPSGNMVLDLEKLNPDKIWNEVFTNKRKQRNHINKFENDGFKIKDLDSSNDMKIFFKYYLKNIRYIKGIECPYSHFMDLYGAYFPKNMQITLLHKEDLIAGGLLSFLDESKKIMYLRYLALNRDIPNRYTPPYFLFWDAIKRADKLGFKRICFGTTPSDEEHPAYKLKRNFGCEYENIYSVLIPLSKLFKLGYRTYTSIYPLK